MSINIPGGKKPIQPAKPSVKPSIIPIPPGKQAQEVLSQVPAHDATYGILQTGSNQPAILPTGSNKPTLVFDEDLCQNHLDKVAEFMDQFAGKQGMNPFMWIEKFMKPLYYRMNGLCIETGTSQDMNGEDIYPERTADLQKEILSLPFNEEPTTENIVKRRRLADMKRKELLRQQHQLLPKNEPEQTTEVPKGLQ